MADAAPDPGEGATVIVGFGRVGRLIGEMLREHGQPFIAVDADPATVAAGRRAGFDVFYGDAGRSEMLLRCGVMTTRALVVTMDSPAKVDEVVRVARPLREDLTLIARARDDQHAARLYALGVTDAVPETTEASLQLAENTLVDLGVPMADGQRSFPAYGTGREHSGWLNISPQPQARVRPARRNCARHWVKSGRRRCFFPASQKPGAKPAKMRGTMIKSSFSDRFLPLLR